MKSRRVAHHEGGSERLRKMRTGGLHTKRRQWKQPRAVKEACVGFASQEREKEAEVEGGKKGRGTGMEGCMTVTGTETRKKCEERNRTQRSWKERWMTVEVEGERGKWKGKEKRTARATVREIV